MLPTTRTTKISSKTESNQFCACGCGRKTYIITKTDRKKGHKKGDASKYLAGHAGRKVDTDRAYDVDLGTGCHVWKLNKTSTGYGLISYTNAAGILTSTTAHRFLYEKKYGSLPKDVELDHICRNRACVNLEHLEKVSHLENVRRKKNIVASPQTAYDVRLLYNTGKFMQVELAAMYDISRGAVCSILLDKTWKRETAF